MSSTNKTLHYSLSQYIATDRPTYLGDYNSDMNKIDNALYESGKQAETALNTSTKFETTIGNISDRMTELSQSNQHIEANMTTLNQNVNTAMTNVNSTVSTVSVLQTDVQALKNKDASLDTDITTLNNSMSGINSTLTSATNRLNELSVNLGTISVETTVPAISKTGTSISGVEIWRQPSATKVKIAGVTIIECHGLINFTFPNNTQVQHIWNNIRITNLGNWYNQQVLGTMNFINNIGEPWCIPFWVNTAGEIVLVNNNAKGDTLANTAMGMCFNLCEITKV